MFLIIVQQLNRYVLVNNLVAENLLYCITFPTMGNSSKEIFVLKCYKIVDWENNMKIVWFIEHNLLYSYYYDTVSEGWICFKNLELQSRQ